MLELDETRARTAADVLRPLIYGNVGVEDWGGRQGEDKADDGGGDDDGAEPLPTPWGKFARARRFALAGDTPAAVGLWREIAGTEGLESRQVLQAWHFLRQAGEQPPANIAKDVLGLIVEIPQGSGHDVLAAYEDGSARFLHNSGQATVIEAPAPPEMQSATEDWIIVGRVIASAIGPWDEPKLPELPPDQLRVMMLTPSGPHFGQGPFEALMSDSNVEAFVNAAAKLLTLIADLPTG